MRHSSILVAAVCVAGCTSSTTCPQYQIYFTGGSSSAEMVKILNDFGSAHAYAQVNQGNEYPPLADGRKFISVQYKKTKHLYYILDTVGGVNCFALAFYGEKPEVFTESKALGVDAKNYLQKTIGASFEEFADTSCKHAITSASSRRADARGLS